ncbi:FAD dependent oxidoreductase [Yamadazyma tenuis]|uniref:FAD dependent oxidoreductase domain-containing protein n=1 Tax=Candida tenuis (strain ATCC 10573 / BCRC 21748 / CBS 615 / JCM 9827 / NBRC 10315 / NRRL Y-1498 / VKM Y-70) TaxID=590646 RepID=G3BD35_CANTC|nr:uncharacterized protein CANTEDRAFT_137374 [Yamadazyma tenuis ATCC 10573]EGV60909.1 hypothetical protein CANTEDRAFT_137374 [Yamadazyma tenuis ATCC 10573]WEJ93821.1 FAD dependent oxidoreductase [Yamadazyma tenuis]
MAYSREAKILVVGSGVFGLSSALNLVQNGYKNIEIFDRINHDKTKYNPLNGSDCASGDINKLFRIYYENKTLYSKLAISALDVWEQWNKDIQKLSEEDKSRFIDDDLELVRMSGAMRLNSTSALSAVELTNLEGFNELGLRDLQYNINSKKDTQRAKLVGLSAKLDVIDDWKQRKKVTTISGTLDGVGRMLKADKACFYVKILLEQQGVKFHYDDAGTFISPITDGCEIKGIKTKDGKSHFADLVIVSAGPWSTSLVPALEHHARASLANIVYLEIPKSRQDLINKYSEYPHIQWKTTSSEFDRNKNHSDGEGGFAFFPPTKKEGILKVNTRQLKYWNPVKVDGKYVSVPKTLGDEKLPKSVIQEAKDILMAIAPDVVSLTGIKVTSKLLWYTDAINSDFVIDFVPGYKNLIVATGGSSHGFKFLPVLGRTVVDRINGVSNDYTELFRWKSTDDIVQDNYGLKQDVEKQDYRKFDNAEFLEQQDLIYTEEDLKRLESVVL